MVSLTVSLVKNVEGEIIGASKIARDITERKRAEARGRALMAELTSSESRGDSRGVISLDRSRTQPTADGDCDKGQRSPTLACSGTSKYRQGASRVGSN